MKLTGKAINNKKFKAKTPAKTLLQRHSVSIRATVITQTFLLQSDGTEAGTAEKLLPLNQADSNHVSIKP